MKYESVEVKVPKKILLELEKEKFVNLMKLSTSIHMYNAGILSLGKASELAGKSKEEFMETLSEHKADVIRYSSAELDKELEFLRKKR